MKTKTDNSRDCERNRWPGMNAKGGSQEQSSEGRQDQLLSESSFCLSPFEVVALVIVIFAVGVGLGGLIGIIVAQREGMIFKKEIQIKALPKNQTMTTPTDQDRKATPGPWDYARTDQFDQSIDIFESKTARTLFRSINSLPIEEAEANCKLVCDLEKRISGLTAKIHAAHGLLMPLGNQVTPSVSAIREAIQILRS